VDHTLALRWAEDTDIDGRVTFRFSPVCLQNIARLSLGWAVSQRTEDRGASRIGDVTPL